MSYIPVSGLPMVEETEATGAVAELYDQIRRDFQVPFVPNMSRALSASPGALALHTQLTRHFYQHISLPQSLFTMIFYAIAKTSNCTYCSAGQELTCYTLGIDEWLLTAIIEDLDAVRPERLQAIMSFAIKAAHDPQGMVETDYEKVRDQGVTDSELVEIIITVSIAKYLDSIADILKVEVDDPVTEALTEMGR